MNSSVLNTSGQETHFIRVEFYRFKAFERFTLHVRSFNILVGPNNAGKSSRSHFAVVPVEGSTRRESRC